MKTDLFNFELPEQLIAQKPSEKREEARLLVLDRKTNNLDNRFFYDIPNLLPKDSVLVLNDTKVIPARLVGVKENTNASIEILLLKELKSNEWEALCKPAKKVKIGSIINVLNNDNKIVISFECIGERDEGIRIFKTKYEGIFLERLEEVGRLPLPPYIRKQLVGDDRYQTVYANHNGSAAAPTAGFHFTEEVLAKIKNKGIEIIYVTLHVGLGTFRPVKETDISKHEMHKERYVITEEASEKLNKAKKAGKKIIAVGTTSVRTLESNFVNDKFYPGQFETSIFIYPGYQFRVVDHIITNFHLPKSTLVMLISAFAGRDAIINSYKYAISEKYRFFSFGDSMFIK